MSVSPYLSVNIEALDRFAREYPNIREAFEREPKDAINYLTTICGYVCASCGLNKITKPILKYFNYMADAQCWDCQKNN